MKTSLFEKENIAIFIVLIFGSVISINVQEFYNDSREQQQRTSFEAQISSLTLHTYDAIDKEISQLQQFVNHLSIAHQTSENFSLQFAEYAKGFTAEKLYIKTITVISDKDHHYGELFSSINSGDNEEILIEQLVANIPEPKFDKQKMTAFFPEKSRFERDIAIIIPMRFKHSSEETYILTYIDFHKLLGNVFARSSHDWLNIHLYLNAGINTYIPIFNFSPGRKAFAPSLPLDQGDKRSVFIPGAISLADEAISVLFQPDSSYSFFSWAHYMPLAFGLSITLVICLYLSNLNNRNRNISQVVEQRTLELNQKTAELKKEVSERSKLYNELEHSTEELSALTNSIEGVLWEADPKSFRFTYISNQSERILGYKPSTFLQNQLRLTSMQVDDSDNKVSSQLLQKINDASDSFQLEYKILHADGHELWIRNVITKKFKDNDVTKLYGVMIDISKFKKQEHKQEQMEMQLRQAQKLEAIGQLAAGIAHEINTPAQFVGDNINFLEESVNDLTSLITKYQEFKPQLTDPALAPTIAMIGEFEEEIDLEYLEEEIPNAISQSLDGISRISSIVKAMKEFSHPGSNETQKIDLNQAIESTVTVARNEWKYVADLQLKLDPDLPQVNCFPGELNQTILNMIVNAAHAIEQKNGEKTKGAITISTQSNDSAVDISISDNGSGIPDSVVHKIFDPFFTTKDVGKGTGQGLAIAYSVIVDKHKGNLKVDSKENQGTTFTISLPVS